LADLTATGLHADLWRCATAASPERCLARGRLAPWGDGWALLIDALEGASSATAQKV
jgi:hypothetical protein